MSAIEYFRFWFSWTIRTTKDTLRNANEVSLDCAKSRKKQKVTLRPGCGALNCSPQEKMWLVSIPKYRQARHRQYMELTPPPPPPSKRPSRMGNGHLPNGHLIQNQYSDSGVESQVRVCHNYQLCVNSCSTIFLKFC